MIDAHGARAEMARMHRVLDGGMLAGSGPGGPCRLEGGREGDAGRGAWSLGAGGCG